MPSHEVLAKGKLFLQQEKYQDAILCFKQLLKQDESPEILQALEQAYLGRIRSMAAKSMTKEALVLLDIVLTCWAQADVLTLRLCLLVQAGWFSEAVQLYGQSGKHMASDLRQRLEALFGALLLAGVGGLRPENFPEDSPVARYYPAALSAMDAVFAREEETGQDALKQIPFRSPCRDLRTLLTGLLHFQKDMDMGCGILRKIEKDSPYFRAALRCLATADTPETFLQNLAATPKNERYQLCSQYGEILCSSLSLKHYQGAMAGLKNEVRIESRQLKGALDDFRSVFATLDHAQQDGSKMLEQVKQQEREAARAGLKTLILGLIELHDRMSAGLESKPPQTSFFQRLLPSRQQSQKWLQGHLEGQKMLLGRVFDLLSQCGVTAMNQFVVYPERTIKSIKRLMGQAIPVPLGDKSYLPQEISAMILRHLKNIAETYLGHSVSKAVITVPAFFSDGQRQATREAGQMAGLLVVKIINEPTAATLVYESSHKGAKKVLVYDLGGDDFDALIEKVLMAKLQEDGFADIPLQAKARIRRAAENAKKLLSIQPFALVEEEYLLTRDGVPYNFSIELARQQYEELITPLLDETLDAVHLVLRDAGLTASAIDEILLVGGSTRTPLVQERLEREFGMAPRFVAEPKTMRNTRRVQAEALFEKASSLFEKAGEDDREDMINPLEAIGQP